MLILQCKKIKEYENYVNYKLKFVDIFGLKRC